MKALDRIFNFLLYLVCLVFGLAVVVYAGKCAYLTLQSPNWTETSGQVITSSVSASSGTRTSAYKPLVVYHYTVSGKIYQGNEISYGFSGSFGSSRDKVDQIIAEYPVGSSVRVFYNPAAPALSCLEPGGNVSGYLLPMLAGFLTSVFSAAQGWRTLKAKRL